MNSREEELAQSMYARAWKELGSALKNRKHSFRTGSFATVSNGNPQQRIMTLRHVREGIIGCNCDFRSPKIAELSANHIASWLFYGQPLKLQLQLVGTVQVHHLDEVCKLEWEATPLLSRRCYLAPLPPSCPSPMPDSNLHPGLIEREPTEEESGPGFANFAVLRLHVHQLEVYELAYDGGRRCRFEGENVTWITP